jgi:hypothetical protein
MGDDMLSFEEFLKRILNVLGEARIDYLIGGAVAVWVWGEPRATMDIDFVIHLDVDQVDALSQALEKVEIYLPPDVILNNLEETRVDLPINAVHGASGYKAEMFMLRAGDALRVAAFQRRVKVDFGGGIGEVYVHSPEDVIVYKLLYYAVSQQTKHVRDIGSIVQIMGEDLDYAYIQKWVDVKELASIWEEIKQQLES